jgi:hypothetical protein
MIISFIEMHRTHTNLWQEDIQGCWDDKGAMQPFTQKVASITFLAFVVFRNSLICIYSLITIAKLWQ